MKNKSLLTFSDLSAYKMAISNIQTIDLAHIRENFPTPTCDVKFTFEDKNSGAKSELPAHKLVLALGCDVFMAQFYGPLKEERRHNSC